MNKHRHVGELVAEAYGQSKEDFGQWIWQNHVPVVAKFAEELAEKYGADPDLAVAGAWLHDFGDAFVHRFAENHDLLSKEKGIEVLKGAGYTDEESAIVLEKIIAPHSCRDGFLPETLEGKILATADALAHLTTDFYVQLAWKHIPEGLSYVEFIQWVTGKLERDFHTKIFFDDEKAASAERYRYLTEVFTKRSVV